MKKLALLSMFIIANPLFAQEEPANPQAQETANAQNPDTEVTPAEPTLDPKILDQWTETMRYGISNQRLAVVKKIRFDKESNGLQLLEESFPEENNRLIKEEMIYTFVDLNMNNPEFWGTLIDTENDIVVLQRAAYAVERLNIPVAAQISAKLNEYVTNEEAMRFNAAAVKALGVLKYTEALPIITEMATNRTNHNDLRGAAVVALGDFQDPTLIPTLQNFLTNTIEPRLIRRYAALAIGRTQDREAIGILTPYVTNDTEEQGLRLNAISGLSNFPDEDTLSLMVELSRSDNTAVRTEAIKSLGRMVSQDSQAILEYKAFEDPEAIVRRAARNALTELGFDVNQLEQDRKNPPPDPATTTEPTQDNPPANNEQQNP